MKPFGYKGVLQCMKIAQNGQAAAKNTFPVHTIPQMDWPTIGYTLYSESANSTG